jgi:cysteine rich repeat protein
MTVVGKGNLDCDQIRATNSAKPLDIEPVIRGRSMKITTHSLARIVLLPLLVALSAGTASAQAELGKAIVEKLTAKVAKLESTCAKDIKKYCTTVTPGEGRMIYCMQAHEDKISPQCAYELEDSASSVQATIDGLKDAVLACKVEIAGVCGKTVPGQGRMAACLLANRSAVSKGCEDAIQKVEALSAK